LYPGFPKREREIGDQGPRMGLKRADDVDRESKRGFLIDFF
jgi:hypothetical protein